MDDHGCSEANPCRNAALRWVHTSYCQILTLSADRKALRERVREIEDQRRALGDIAMQTKAQWDSQIAMTVARLGGEVEGAPTHAGNFLQRIDALRKVERAALAPRSEGLGNVYTFSPGGRDNRHWILPPLPRHRDGGRAVSKRTKVAPTLETVVKSWAAGRAPEFKENWLLMEMDKQARAELRALLACADSLRAIVAHWDGYGESEWGPDDPEGASMLALAKKRLDRASKGGGK